MKVFAVAALFFTTSHLALSVTVRRFSYASYYEDHMVLQIAPYKSSVWGYATVTDIGATVTVNLTSTAMSPLTFTGIVQHGVDPGQAVWRVEFTPLVIAHPVTVTAFLNNYEPIVLLDVIFGDVWICSGQSNMKFAVQDIFNAHDVAVEAIKYRKSIRFFSVGQVTSTKPVYDVNNIELHWSLPDEKTILPFSAVCWLFATNIYNHRQVPMGLIESSWGGTNIEAWSSPDSLHQCHIYNQNQHLNSYNWQTIEMNVNMDNSVLWNAMIHPLLNLTIYGVIWYQGEANTAYNRDVYNCTFPAMITDWRQKWFVASNGLTDLQLPFGFVQIGPTDGKPVVAGYADIRWHQTADIGYAPNKLLDNVFMAVSFDLTDKDVHYRDKATVSRRLSLSGLAVAYHIDQLKYQGPWPTAIIPDVFEHIVTVEFDFNKYPVIVKNTVGFEVCCSKVACDIDGLDWLPTPVILPLPQFSVQLNASLCTNIKLISALRYGWRETPFAYLKAAVYSQMNDLPTPPFVSFVQSQQHRYRINWHYNSPPQQLL